MSSKHPQSGGSKPHSHPKENNARDEEQGVPSNVHVRGEISIEPSPKEALARSTEQEQKKSYENRKWWIERASFIVLSIYAALTFWQSCNTQRIATLTEKQFTTDQRPYVLVDAVKKEVIENTLPFVDMNVDNFGKSPALNVAVTSGLIYGPDALQRLDVTFARLVQHPPQDVSSRSTIPPGSVSTGKGQFFTLRFGPDASQKAIDQFFASDLNVVAISHITYRDMAGNTYTTDSCSAFFATGAIAQCPSQMCSRTSAALSRSLNLAPPNQT